MIYDGFSHHVKMFFSQLFKALLGMMEESCISAQSAHFLNEICAFIFQPKLMKVGKGQFFEGATGGSTSLPSQIRFFFLFLLQDEYERLEKDSACVTPIRDMFRKLIEIAGTKRPHVSRAVLSRIVVGWLDDGGLNAIPYRDVCSAMISPFLNFNVVISSF